MERGKRRFQCQAPRCAGTRRQWLCDTPRSGRWPHSEVWRPIFAHPCVIDGVEHEIDDSSVPSYVAKVQAVHNELHVYEVQNYTVGIPVTITPTNDNVAENDEQICFRVRAAYSGQSSWRSVNTDCISLQDAIPDSTPVATASASHRYGSAGGSGEADRLC